MLTTNLLLHLYLLTQGPLAVNHQMVSVFGVRGWRLTGKFLPLVMGVSLVSFGHLVGIFAAFDGRAGIVSGVNHFGGELFGHAATAAGAAPSDSGATARGATAAGDALPL